jgi:hypothetical protein
MIGSAFRPLPISSIMVSTTRGCQQRYSAVQSLFSSLPKRSGLWLGGKKLAPAARADVTFDEFAGVRRLKIDAAIAALVILRHSLIFGVRLADLLLSR